MIRAAGVTGVQRRGIPRSKLHFENLCFHMSILSLSLVNCTLLNDDYPGKARASIPKTRIMTVSFTGSRSGAQIVRPQTFVSLPFDR